MNNEIKSKILTGIAAAGIIALGGCGPKSDCEIPSRHVHKYVRQVTDDITIEQYRDSEKVIIGQYDWTNDYIEITKFDEKLYKLLNKHNLFLGSDNWDYLYNVMANNHDYLSFYYEYDTVETSISIDSDGNTHLNTYVVHHDGWTSNPNYYNNTGLTRLYHHRYVGYRIVNNNGKFELEESEPVDDIREIIDEYPYFAEKCATLVYKQFRYRKSELAGLSPDDYDVFVHPDLNEQTMSLK